MVIFSPMDYSETVETPLWEESFGTVTRWRFCLVPMPVKGGGSVDGRPGSVVVEDEPGNVIWGDRRKRSRLGCWGWTGVCLVGNFLFGLVQDRDDFGRLPRVKGVSFSTSGVSQGIPDSTR